MTELFYGEVFRKLKEKKINYLVVGGIAVALHGAPRFTTDADFALQLVPDNIKKFLLALEELGYEPKAPINPKDFANPKKRSGWIKEKGLKVLSFWNTKDSLKLIDVFVANPIDFQDMAKEKQTKTAAGIEVPIPSLRHLIKLKRIAGRPQDLRDIELLERIHGQDKKK